MADSTNNVHMTRRRAVQSLASLGAAGALAPVVPAAFAQSSPPVPTLTDLAPFRVGTTNSWHNVPWGTATWVEPSLGMTLTQDLDITTPTGTPPAGGWPVIVHFHATGTTKSVSSNGPIGIYVRAPAVTAGFAFVTVEFRHPVSNSDISPIPHTDTGLALQFIRSLHSALSLDRSNVFGLCRSRGNLAFWQSLQPDMAVASASTYAGRQSSLLKAIWSASGQVTYQNHEWAQLFIVPEDRADWEAANEDNPAWGSALQSLPTAPASQVPDIVMLHELPYYNQLMDTSVLDANGEPVVNDKHYPDNGRVMRDAYRANGYADRILTIDNTLNNNASDQLIDCVPWVQAIMSGARGVEAWAIVRAKTRGHALYYARTPNDARLGVWTNATGSTATALNGPVGWMVDGSYGLANRSVFTGQAGVPAVQDSNNNKPVLAQFPNGSYGIRFDANDRLAIPLVNSASTQSCYSWTETAEYNVPALVTSTYLMIGQANMASQTMSLCIANANPGTMLDNDLKGFRQFANLIAGTSFA